ncbi:MAG: hypothetical protein ACXAEN_17925 [Candidatus Thorarchaeota archaeon]|jgi:hypothetical protein
MRGLSDAELANLDQWDNLRLINAFARYSDRAYLMALQDASGIANKSNSDPDVATLIKTRDTIRKELEQRLKANKSLATTFESYKNAIAHHSAWRARALGIPDDEKSTAEIVQIKSNIDVAYAQIETAIGS